MPTNLNIYENGAIDFARPPKEVIFERFNAINGTSFNPDDFLLTDVEASIGPNYNAIIKAMPVNTSQWSKGFPIYYSRVLINEQMQHPAEVPTNGETNLYGLLDTINAAYGIYLTEADVQDALISYNDPLDPTGTGNVQLITRATSIFFYGTITIPVNNTVSHGVSVYDDELVHFLAVRGGGTDRVIARDALGQTLDTFTFGGVGVSWNSSNISQLFKKTDGTLIVIGNFNYMLPADHPMGSGSRIDKVLFLSVRGDIVDATAGALFGLNYAGLKYIEAFEQDRVYALDVLGTIGGNSHGVVVFKSNGEVDTAFTAAITKKVDALTFYEDKIYVGSRNGDDATLKRMNLDGSIDTAFPEVAITLPCGRPVDHGRIEALCATARGVAILVKPNTESGQTAWSEVSSQIQATGMSAPVIVIGHDGVQETVFTTKHPLMTTLRTGVAEAGGQIALTSRSAVYIANTCDLATGVRKPNIAAVNQEGAITGAYNNVNINDFPFYTSYAAMQLSTRGDVIVAGNALLDINGVPTDFGLVVAYDFQGNFAARLLTVADKRILAYQHHRFM